MEKQMSNASTELPSLDEIEQIAEVKESLPSVDQLDSVSESIIAYLSSPMFVASFFLFILFLLVFIFMKNLIKNGKDPIDILKTFGVPLIIASSSLIVVTGLEMQTLTPVIGLLGTIAGYLLGQKENSTNK
jgi:hypothetical protein